MWLIKWFKGSYLERGRGDEGRERASGGRGLHVAFDLRLHLSPVAWTTLPHCSASPLLLSAPALAAFFPPLKLLLHWRELGPLRIPFAAPAGGRGELGSGRGVGGAAAGSGLASAAATWEPSCGAARAHHCGGSGVWPPPLRAQPHHRRRRRRCTGVWLLLPYFTLV